jgi:hypothetical protein
LLVFFTLDLPVDYLGVTPIGSEQHVPTGKQQVTSP